MTFVQWPFLSLIVLVPFNAITTLNFTLHLVFTSNTHKALQTGNGILSLCGDGGLSEHSQQMLHLHKKQAKSKPWYSKSELL